jgi:hypothetical protein
MFLLVAMLDKKSCVYQVMWAHDKIHIHKVQRNINKENKSARMITLIQID